jgi:hypothetical protein
MTKDQQDTAFYLEQAFRYFDPGAMLYAQSVNKTTGRAVFKMNASGGREQIIEIHPNGKPAWDGEQATKSDLDKQIAAGE